MPKVTSESRGRISREEDKMRIGELAKLSDLTVETIRFYESEGLIPKAERSLNNYRSYTESHLKRLLFIKHCRSLDMSLDEIRILTDVDARRNEDADRVHSMIAQHIHKIDQQIEDLKHLKQHLALLALCCHGNHANGEPCGLIEGLTNQACCHNCEGLKSRKSVTKKENSKVTHSSN